MTTEEFNALPLEARRFIELHAGCLSCGNKESKLTKAYELYKANKMENVYQLFGGGINYVVEGQKGVLYNIRQDDTPEEVRTKLEIAARINEVSPQSFISYDKRGIEDLLASLPEVKVINLDDADKWAERSAILGIDTKTATYPELQDFVRSQNVETAGQKKSDLVSAIDALQIEHHSDLE